MKISRVLIKGSNQGFTPDSFAFDCTCYSNDNSLWATFYTNQIGEITITGNVICERPNEGMEIMIYDEDLKPVEPCQILLPNRNNRLSFNDLEPYTKYFIMLDSHNGDICSFNLKVKKEPFLPPQMILEHSIKPIYCIGTELCYSLINVIDIAETEWILPPKDSIVSGGQNGDLEVCIHYKEEGEKLIKANILNLCDPDTMLSTKEFISADKNLVGIDSIYANKEHLCRLDIVTYRFKNNFDPSITFNWRIPSNLFFILDGGEPTDTFLRVRIVGHGKSPLVVTPNISCALPYRHMVEVPFRERTFITKEICPENGFTFNGVIYTEPGLHRIVLPTADMLCDSTISLHLIERDVHPSPTIDCCFESDRIKVDWESTADSFKITVNRSTDFFVKKPPFNINKADFPEGAIVKVQPLDACTFLPGEVSCFNPVSSVESTSFNDAIKVFPNPTNGFITIESVQEVRWVEIYDISGKFLQRASTNKIEVLHQIPGLYFLKINTEKGISVKRVLVQ